ncbi:Atu4866 domain-containing protein [Pedobacter sp.]|uniref:Atu4866 domain-containing protein n=1 Tax=Pedobacter sp. TaxID=1411316 RepID=UPI003BA87FA5
MKKTIEETKEYLGIWISADGQNRHELLPNMRYRGAGGALKDGYQGSYNVVGDHIDYEDDSGFSAEGDFRDGILFHGGTALFKKFSGVNNREWELSMRNRFRTILNQIYE